jgi:hypothetical protein
MNKEQHARIINPGLLNGNRATASIAGPLRLPGYIYS